MSSRERLLRALNHEETDRIPIDFGGNLTGIHQFAYEKLLAHLGMNDPSPTLMDVPQRLSRPCEELLRRFHVDTRYIATKYPEHFDGEVKKNTRAGRLWHDLTDEFGVVWSMPDDRPNYMDITHHPLDGATLKDLAAYPFPKGTDRSRFVGLREQAMAILNDTPYAVVSSIAGMVYETCWYMRGLERWFLDMADQPEFCEALIDRMLKYWLDWFDGFLAEVGDIIDVITLGDDLAGQTGPLFSPSFYREVVKPRHKKLIQHIRAKTNAKIWYHTCGACTVFLPDLIDNGVEALNPVQISASGMIPFELKPKFGEKLTFWGGAIDSQHVLPTATPEIVREHVRRNVEIWKPGGGYVFSGVHNIQADVPPENVVAMFDAAYEFGFYS